MDTTPILEREWAMQAGIGWIGKNTLVLDQQLGSYFFLGEIVTTLTLDCDAPGTDHCGSCTRCLEACPTQAFPAPYQMDARRCISYLTIEYRGDLNTIPQELRSKMGNRIFGCDDCLDVCPYNVNALPTKESAFFPTPLTQSPKLTQLSQMNEDIFANTFEGSPIRRPKHAGFQRNVQVAICNDPTLPNTSNSIPQS